MLSISVSLVAVFIPLLLMGGIVGRLFREFAITVTAAIAVSALVSLTLTPMLARASCITRPGSTAASTAPSNAVFDGMLSFYRAHARRRAAAPLHHADDVLRHHGGERLSILAIPKGFFPIQDTGLITGFAEAAQDVSPQEMARLMVQLGDVVLRRIRTSPPSGQPWQHRQRQTANTGRFFIGLKPRDQRSTDATRDHRPVATAACASRRRQRSRFSHRRTSPSAGASVADSSNTRCRIRISASSTTGRRRFSPSSRRCRSSPTCRPTSSRNAPAIDGQHQSRPGGTLRHHAEVIDDTLNDAFGQRQVAQYYTQTNTYHVILEVPPEMQGDPNTLDRIYLKSPLTDAASAALDASSPSTTRKLGRSRSRIRASFRRSRSRSTCAAGVALGQAVDAINKAVPTDGHPEPLIGSVPGQRASLPGFARQRAGADPRGAGRCLS